MQILIDLVSDWLSLILICSVVDRNDSTCLVNPSFWIHLIFCILDFHNGTKVYFVFCFKVAWFFLIKIEIFTYKTSICDRCWPYSHHNFNTQLQRQILLVMTLVSRHQNLRRKEASEMVITIKSQPFPPTREKHTQCLVCVLHVNVAWEKHVELWWRVLEVKQIIETTSNIFNKNGSRAEATDRCSQKRTCGTVSTCVTWHLLVQNTTAQGCTKTDWWRIVPSLERTSNNETEPLLLSKYQNCCGQRWLKDDCKCSTGTQCRLRGAASSVKAIKYGLNPIDCFFSHAMPMPLVMMPMCSVHPRV